MTIEIVLRRFAPDSGFTSTVYPKWGRAGSGMLVSARRNFGFCEGFAHRGLCSGGLRLNQWGKIRKTRRGEAHWMNRSSCLTIFLNRGNP